MTLVILVDNSYYISQMKFIPQKAVQGAAKKVAP